MNHLDAISWDLSSLPGTSGGLSRRLIGDQLWSGCCFDAHARKHVFNIVYGPRDLFTENTDALFTQTSTYVFHRHCTLSPRPVIFKLWTRDPYFSRHSLRIPQPSNRPKIEDHRLRLQQVNATLRRTILTISLRCTR